MEMDETYIELDSDEDGERTNTNVSMYRFPFGRSPNKLKAIGQTNLRKMILFDPKPTKEIRAFNFNDDDDEIKVVGTTKGNNNYAPKLMFHERAAIAKKVEDLHKPKEQQHVAANSSQIFAAQNDHIIGNDKINEQYKQHELPSDVSSSTTPHKEFGYDYDGDAIMEDPIHQPAPIQHNAMAAANANAEDKTLQHLNEQKTLILKQLAQKNCAVAAQLCIQTVEELKNNYGHNHPDVAQMLGILAQVYRRQNEYEKTAQVLNESLAIREHCLGQDHPHVTANVHNLAVIYVKCGKYKEAEPLIIRLIEIRKKELGPHHPDVDKLQKMLTFNQKQKISKMTGVNQTPETRAKPIEAEAEFQHKWKKKMNTLTQYEQALILRMEQQMIAVEVEPADENMSKISPEKRNSSKQFEKNNLAHENDKRNKILQLREDLDKMIYERNEANAKIEQLNNQLREQEKAHSKETDELEKKLNGKEEIIKKLESEIVALKNDKKQMFLDELAKCRQQFVSQINELQRKVEGNVPVVYHQHEEQHSQMGNPLFLCQPDADQNQTAMWGNHDISVRHLNQAEEYSNTIIMGGQECSSSSTSITTSAMASPITSTPAAPVASTEQHELEETMAMIEDNDADDVEFVEEVLRDVKMMMPRMKKEGEDWTQRFVPVVTIEDDEANAASIPKFNWRRHMEKLKRRPQIKKEEPNDEEYEQQQPGTSAASAKEKPKQTITPSPMYLRERKRGPGLYKESPVKGNNKKSKK